MRGNRSGKSNRPSMGNGWNAGMHGDCTCTAGRVDQSWFLW